MKRVALKCVKWAVGLALTVSFVLSPMGAAASQRWYGVAAWYNATTNLGSSTDMLVVSGTCADWNINWGFVASVLWQGTNNDTGLNYRVEEGYTYGWQGQNILTFYWADNRPNGGGYHEHPITDITPSQYSTYNMEIFWYHTNWLVTINSVDEGNSTNNPAYGKALETGTESTSSQSVLNSAESNNLAYDKSGSGWISGWGGATQLISNAPAYAYWNIADVNLIDGI